VVHKFQSTFLIFYKILVAFHIDLQMIRNEHSDTKSSTIKYMLKEQHKI